MAISLQVFADTVASPAPPMSSPSCSLQTKTIGPCFNFDQSNTQYAPESIPEDLSGIRMTDRRPPFSLSGKILRFANLRMINFNNKKVEGANLERAVLVGAVASHTSFKGSRLQFTDLNGAKLFDARMRGVDLCRASLRYADLSFADLRESNLVGADLDSAFTLGAKFENAKFSKQTHLPFSEVEALKRGMILVEQSCP